MARTHGRTSSYVRRDIGPMAPARWHSWQCCCRMGATFFANVTLCAAANGPEAAKKSTASADPLARTRLPIRVLVIEATFLYIRCERHGLREPGAQQNHTIFRRLAGRS